MPLPRQSHPDHCFGGAQANQQVQEAATATFEEESGAVEGAHPTLRLPSTSADSPPHRGDKVLDGSQVSDFAEIYNLSRLPDLQVLSLTENPIASEPDYRQKILAYLPNLQKLDDTLVTPDEVEEAQARCGSTSYMQSGRAPVATREKHG